MTEDEQAICESYTAQIRKERDAGLQSDGLIAEYHSFLAAVRARTDIENGDWRHRGLMSWIFG